MARSPRWGFLKHSGLGHPSGDVWEQSWGPREDKRLSPQVFNSQLGGHKAQGG